MNFKEQEQRLEIFRRDGWVCQNCGMRLSHPRAVPQIAHILNQNKVNIKLYGKELIHHPLNLKSACGLLCNQKLSIYGKYGTIQKHVEKIQKAIDDKVLL